MPPSDLSELRAICRDLRADIIEMLCLAGSGHPGGSLSAVEIMVSLFWGALRHDPANPEWLERDRLVLSKGHGCPALYAAMARRGYFPREELWNLRKTGAMLQGHPVRSFTPGVEACTGALGQGLGVAQGMALAAKIDHAPWRVWCILGDGEIQEGSIWEAAMSAGKYRVDNLVAILDCNGGQIDGSTAEVMDLEPVLDKWRAFNWNVIDVADGHDLEALLSAIGDAIDTRGKPTLIVARTVKGKGVSFMEHPCKWHGVAPTREEADRALAEIRGGGGA
ncbi:transketolase [Candidatus Sumerlaeota bacterium]|nr:transketolase [Candidatus Sumerlaeota bacterium]